MWLQYAEKNHNSCMHLELHRYYFLLGSHFCRLNGEPANGGSKYWTKNWWWLLLFLLLLPYHVSAMKKKKKKKRIQSRQSRLKSSKGRTDRFGGKKERKRRGSNKPAAIYRAREYKSSFEYFDCNPNSAIIGSVCVCAYEKYLRLQTVTCPQKPSYPYRPFHNFRA